MRATGLRWTAVILGVVGAGLVQVAGAAQVDSLRQRAVPCLTGSLQQTAPMLSDLLACLDGNLGLVPDSTRAWAGRQVQIAGGALAEERTQQLLAARWAADKEVYKLKPEQGVRYLQALCNELAKALDSGRNYSLQALLQKAGSSARLADTQLRPALLASIWAAGVSSPETVGAAGDAIDLELEVLSEEMLDRIPRSVFAQSDWGDHFCYQFILFPVRGTALFDTFFLAPQLKQQLWDRAAAQLTDARVCRRVLVPQEGHAKRGPRLSVMATLKMAEARHDGQSIAFKGGVPVPRGGVYGNQISQRETAPRVMFMLLELCSPDRTEPVWRYWSLAAVDVTVFGQSPFAGDTRRYPTEVTFREPIIEDVFIEKLRGSL
jgi:hypothetical protein